MHPSLDLRGARQPASDLIREAFVSDNPAAVETLRRSLWSGGHEFVSPGLADFLNMNADEPPKAYAWLLAAEQEGWHWVLDYSESEDRIPGADKEGFLAWLERFSPVNCNDWLMVPFLYQRHVFDEGMIDWHALPFAIDTVLDNLLRPTRGLLLWKHQFNFLFREVLNLSNGEADRFRRKCLQQQVEALALLERTYFGGRTLADIIDERTLGGTYLAGGPDFHLSGFLSEQMTSFSGALAVPD